MLILRETDDVARRELERNQESLERRGSERYVARNKIGIGEGARSIA